MISDKKISHLGFSKMLLSELDLNRGVKGGRVSNSLLDFRQFSFTHVIQVLGSRSGTRFPSSPLFRHAIVP